VEGDAEQTTEGLTDLRQTLELDHATGQALA
jgi:hypothetical protein